MDVLPEIVKYHDVPNETEWVEIVLVFDPDTKEYKIYKDKQLEFQTTDKQFVAKFAVEDPIKTKQRSIEVKKGVGFECTITNYDTTVEANCAFLASGKISLEMRKVKDPKNKLNFELSLHCDECGECQAYRGNESDKEIEILW
ncbi:unnamed protein product [Caenorhabditis brenneri]